MLWFHNAKMCGKEICPGFVTSLWSEEFGEDYSHQALLLHRVCCEASLACQIVGQYLYFAELLTLLFPINSVYS
jgi:hypothetical protein